MCQFFGIEIRLWMTRFPTRRRFFQRLLERHRLTEVIFISMNRLLTNKRLLLKSGMLVKPGDCYAFRSHGSIKSPPVQALQDTG